MISNVGGVSQRGEHLIIRQIQRFLNVSERFSGAECPDHGGDINTRSGHTRLPVTGVRIHRYSWKHFHNSCDKQWRECRLAIGVVGVKPAGVSCFVLMLKAWIEK